MSPPNALNSRVQVPIVLGDSCVEPLSGKEVRVSSCRILVDPRSEDKILPCAGGYQSFLDASVLSSEEKILEAMKELRDAISGEMLIAFSSLLHQIFLTNIII